MNELKKLITDYQKTHHLTRNTLIQKLGYKNITKGLRRLDAFIEHPKNNAFKAQLCKQLDISIESMDLVVNKQIAIVERKMVIVNKIVNKDLIKNFTPHIRVKWTRLPSLLMAAQGSQHLYEIGISETLLKRPLEKQLEEVVYLYKQHQLDHFAEAFNLKNTIENYAELLRIIDTKLKAGIDIGWSIGNGFTYHKAFNESYQFNKTGERVIGARDINVSEASWDYVRNKTFINTGDGVIGY